MNKIFKIILLTIGIILLFSIFSLFWTDNKKVWNGYIYYPDNKMISSSEGIYGEIPSVVLSFDYDNNFIIAKQKPIENDPNALLYDFEYKYIEGYNTNYYWIIIKDSNFVLGPLCLEEFNNKTKEWNIRLSLD